MSGRQSGEVSQRLDTECHLNDMGSITGPTRHRRPLLGLGFPLILENKLPLLPGEEAFMFTKRTESYRLPGAQAFVSIPGCGVGCGSFFLFVIIRGAGFLCHWDLMGEIRIE